MAVIVLTVAACGGGGGSSASAPSGLSYMSPTSVDAGSVATFSPTVTGSVTSYTVSPTLPAGLSLNSSSGVISGTPTSAAAQATYTITATNSAGSTSFAWTLTVNPPPPSKLSYTSPLTATVGNTLNAGPTVTGTVSNYSINPSLPAGLTLNASSGVISGTPTATSAQANYTVTASNSSGQTTCTVSLAVNPPPPSGLSYGNSTPPFVVGVSTISWAPTVTGQVSQYTISPASPNGPALPGGLVFNTSTGVISGTPAAATAQPGTYTVTASNVSGSTTKQISLQVNSGPTVALSVSAIANAGANLNYEWKTTDGQLVDATGTAVSQTTSSVAYWELPQGTGLHFAYVLVYDGSGNCSEGRLVVDSDSFGAPTTNPVPPVASKLSYSPVSCTYLTDPFFNVTATSSPPSPPTSSISSMSATYNGSSTYNGNPFWSYQQVFPNGPSGEPSNSYIQANYFLSASGGDSATSSCAYYNAIGAWPTADCLNGNPNTALTLDQWTKKDGFTSANNSVVSATYVNVVDLNLTRRHYSVVQSGGNPTLAAYVCNHLGPSIAVSTYSPTATLPPDQQTAVDGVVNDALAGQNEIACVAMDYYTDPVYGAYTRFFVFGPSGELLPSVNLDGRGEKYVPGACVACHGGTSYSIAQTPALNAFFLPYDNGNFAFADSLVGQGNYTEAAMAPQIYQLNANVVNPYASNATTTGTKCLVGAGGCTQPGAFGEGWYGLSLNSGQNPPSFAFNYIPTSWSAPSTPLSPSAQTDANNVYTYVVARSCRTCHTAIPTFNWDQVGPQAFIQSSYSVLCSINGSLPSMPNSLITFNRFWNSQLEQGLQNQVADYNALYDDIQSVLVGPPTPPPVPLNCSPTSN
jgi:hypothetical protein